MCSHLSAVDIKHNLIKIFSFSDSRMCSHLLAADVEHGNFAVVSSAEGITVLTKTSMTTVHKGGNVFIDRCNQPVYVYIIRSKFTFMVVDHYYLVQLVCLFNINYLQHRFVPTLC